MCFQLVPLPPCTHCIYRHPPMPPTNRNQPRKNSADVKLRLAEKDQRLLESQEYIQVSPQLLIVSHAITILCKILPFVDHLFYSSYCGIYIVIPSYIVVLASYTVCVDTLLSGPMETMISGWQTMQHCSHNNIHLASTCTCMFGYLAHYTISDTVLEPINH